MSERLRHAEVQADLPGWRVLLGRVHATYRTGTFASGVAFVSRVNELAEAANHHPDVDLRYAAVSVSLVSQTRAG